MPIIIIIMTICLSLQSVFIEFADAIRSLILFERYRLAILKYL